MYERQEKSNLTNAWASDNFSGLYKAARSSSLGVYWTQNFTNVSQTLLVAFQEPERPNTFTIGKYTSYQNVSNEWVSTKYNNSILQGSPLSFIPFTGSRELALYAAKPKGYLGQYRYTISNGSIQEFGCKSLYPLTGILLTA